MFASLTQDLKMLFRPSICCTLWHYERLRTSPPYPICSPKNPRMRIFSSNNYQKRRICAEVDHHRSSHETSTYDYLVDWAITKFGLTEHPSRTTITHILRMLPLSVTIQYRRIYESFQNLQWKRHALGVTLYHYICDILAKCINLSRSLMRKTVDRL